jgi:hypothetical protein
MHIHHLHLPHLTLWQHLSTRTQGWIVFHSAAVIAGGLALDAAFGWAGQIATIVWAFAVWGWLYKIGRTIERRALVLCIAIGAAGEVFLSLGWGVYTYQFGNIPLYVPPGHALMMTLGLLAAGHMRPAATVAVVLLGAAWGMYAWVSRFDQLGALLFLFFAASVLVSRARNLYAVMFVFALVMELYATALGNWVWHAQAPFLNITASNPPFSAGAFYCLLDMLVLAGLRGCARFAARAAT